MSEERVIDRRYRLLRNAGSGSSASVWEAIDERTGGTVAVKLLHANLTDDPDQRERFARQAGAAAMLRSPFVAQVFASGDDAGQPYIVMEFVGGGTLAHELRNGRIGTERVLRILSQMALALADAHSHGIVHRDVKPSNILITPQGDAKLGDLGVAQLSADNSYTIPGAFLGTLRYAAPETFDGNALPASDLYALGIVGYQMLTGSLPFQADTHAAMMDMQRSQPPPMHRLDPADHHLGPIIERLLQKRSDARYPDAMALVLALAGDEATLARPPQPSANARVWPRRALTAAAATIAALLIGVGAFVFISRDADADDPSGGTPTELTSAERTFFAVAAQTAEPTETVAATTTATTSSAQGGAPAPTSTAAPAPTSPPPPPPTQPQPTHPPPPAGCSGSDFDGDGVCTGTDLCEGTPTGWQPVDGVGCAQLQVDFDTDNVCDAGRESPGPNNCTGTDLCDGTPTGWQPVDQAGCAQLQVDFDTDGVCDPGRESPGPQNCVGSDSCPGTPTAWRPVDANGCAAQQTQ